MKKIALHWQILIGILIGIILGIYFKGSVPYFTIIGNIFLRALKMIVVPLVVTSMISGVTSMQDNKSLGRIGSKTLAYYVATSLLALLLGLFLVNTFKPGIGVSLALPENTNLLSQPKSLVDTILEIVPENIFKALAQADMLALIFFSILFGIFINKLETPKRELLSNVFDSIFKVMMNITMWVIRFAPIGIMGIVSKVVAEQQNISELLSGLGKFAGVVVLGLLIHFFIILPLLLLIISRTNPLKHYQAMMGVILTAFSTASSNATLPVTIQAMEEKSGVSNRIASFTLPLGATINMNGTALYELVVAGFISQVYGIELTFAQQFILVLTALLSSIGTAGIPMASFVTMSIIFTAVGLPVEAMLIVMPIDRPLDMMRTTVNVFGDTIVTVIVAKSEKEQLNY
jgi:Na+/H+-dicarboxylate symporter